VINLELPWNPAVLEQRIGRIYRLGQKLPIDVYNLVSEQGIESRIADLVGSKQAFFKGLFDGDSDTVDFGQSAGFLSKVQKLYDAATLAAAASSGDQAGEDTDVTDASLDDDVMDPFDELIDAGDESRDPQPALPSPNGDGVLPQAALEAPSPSPSPVPPPLPFEPAAPPSPTDETETPTATAVAALPSAGEVRQFFGQLQVRRADNGRVVIEAPAEAASTLGALFEGMAALLQSLSQTPPK
jgi:hypothetical protein